MPLTIQMTQVGGPEVLVAKELPSEPLKPGELRLRHTVIGFNFVDVYLRRGTYEAGPMPAILGFEGAGTVTEVGKGVTGFAVGDRVAYTNEMGAYSTERRLDAVRAIPLPGDVPDEVAAALLFKGQTAHMLLKRSYKVSSGDKILVQSAGSGVGMVLSRWAKSLGATVIGTVSSPAKVELAKQNGCDAVVVTGKDDVVAQVREATGGTGVNAVYDANGRATFETSMKCLAPFGVMVSYGQASGEIPPIEPRPLSRYGSPLFTRPNIDHHILDPARYQEVAAEVLKLIRSGVLVANIAQRFPLLQVAEAHRQAERRELKGTTLIIP